MLNIIFRLMIRGLDIRRQRKCEVHLLELTSLSSVNSTVAKGRAVLACLLNRTGAVAKSAVDATFGAS